MFRKTWKSTPHVHKVSNKQWGSQHMVHTSWILVYIDVPESCIYPRQIHIRVLRKFAHISIYIYMSYFFTKICGLSRTTMWKQCTIRTKNVIYISIILYIYYKNLINSIYVYIYIHMHTYIHKYVDTWILCINISILRVRPLPSRRERGRVTCWCASRRRPSRWARGRSPPQSISLGKIRGNQPQQIAMICIVCIYIYYISTYTLLYNMFIYTTCIYIYMNYVSLCIWYITCIYIYIIYIHTSGCISMPLLPTGLRESGPRTPGSKCPGDSADPSASEIPRTEDLFWSIRGKNHPKLEMELMVPFGKLT